MVDVRTSEVDAKLLPVNVGPWNVHYYEDYYEEAVQMWRAAESEN
jgi:hypothetical protein